MRCPACAHDNRDVDRFCIACGTRLEPPCPRCGTPPQPGARFCGACGAPLSAPEPAPPSAPAPPATATPYSPLPTPSADAERRQLTVLFCDLVDSTPLSGRLDPEELRDLVRAYQQACAEVVARYSGHIAQFLGDGILVYFGYPQAHEDDAIRAVRAALAMAEAVPRQTGAMVPDAGAVAVRIGIHTGLVVVGEVGSGDHHEQLALGETPNLAARLQGLAGANGVVISAATHRLVQGFFHCEPLGAPALKGISQPQAVYQVRGETGAANRLDVAAAAGLSPLVGRDEEVEFLLERWRQAAAGGLEVVVVAGEPGIGKSRLVRDLRERLEQSGQPWAWVELRCGQVHEQSALYPLIDHYQRLLQFTTDDTAETRVARLEMVLAEYGFPLAEAMPLFVPLLSLPLPARYPPPAMTAERQKQKTLDASLEWLEKEAARHPTLFVVEDLQWIDPSTLELLGNLVDQQPEAPILALLTCRPEFVPPWPFHDRLRLLTLGRLGRAQAVAVIRGIAGGRPLPAELEEQIVARTDGVPLFVEELTRMVLESGLVEEANGRYALTGPLRALAIPETLQDSLMARLDRLSAVKEVAQLGAVAGREFSYELVRAVARVDEATLQQALTRLVEAGLVSQRGLPPAARYRFRHTLIQEAAYQSLLRSRRQQLHGEVARVLEARFPEVGETQPEVLAHHFVTAGEREKGVDYLLRAAQRSAGRYAIKEALNFLQRALELSPMSTARDDILEARARLLLGQYRGKEAAHDFEQLVAHARDRGNRKQELESLLGLASAHYIIALDEPGGMGQARGFYEQAYALARALGDRAGMARALIPTHYFVDHWPDYRAQAQANVEEAIELSRELGNDELIVESMSASMRFLSPAEAEGPAEELRGLLEARHELVRLNDHQFRLMWLHYNRGNYARCVEVCDGGFKLAEEIGSEPVQYATIKGLALTGLGRYGEAWASLQQEVADEAHPFGRTHKELGEGVYYYELMAYADAAATLRRVVEQARVLHRVWMRNWASPLLARTLARAGRLDGETLGAVEGDLKEIESELPPEARAEVLLFQGQAAEALEQAERAAARAERNGRRPDRLTALEIRLRVLLALDRAAEALTAADEALALAEEIGARPMQWRILAARAQAHDRLGNADAAAADRQAAAAIVRALAESIPDPRLQQGYLSDSLVSSLIADAGHSAETKE